MMVVTWLGLAFGAPIGDRRVTVADFETRDAYMRGIDLVIVMREYPAEWTSVPYAGPTLVMDNITQGIVEVDEVLFGSLEHPFLYLWSWGGSTMISEGILFAERWNLESISGVRYDVGYAQNMFVASDAVSAPAGLTLEFRGEEVWGSFGPMCVNPADFLRGCEPGETPSTPDEVVAHLRSVLAGSPGLHLAGADPAGLPPRREAAP